MSVLSLVSFDFIRGEIVNGVVFKFCSNFEGDPLYCIQDCMQFLVMSCHELQVLSTWSFTSCEMNEGINRMNRKTSEARISS